MHNLLSLQQAFQAQLLGEKSNFSSFVVVTMNPSAKERINIYAVGYANRLIDALTGNYAKLQQYMGEDKFNTLAKAYLALYPSHFRSIRWFGNKLPIFLQQHPPYYKRPVLAELAKFEWAIENAFDAQDAKTMSVEDFKNIPPDKWASMKFIFHPTLRYQTFSYNIIPLWEAILNSSAKRATILKNPQPVIFWRYNLDTVYRALSEMEAGILTFAMAGESFAVLCEKICQWVTEEEAAVQAATLLINWLSSGLIIGISLI